MSPNWFNFSLTSMINILGKVLEQLWWQGLSRRQMLGTFQMFMLMLEKTTRCKKFWKWHFELLFDAGSHVLEQKVWSCKYGKMQTRPVSGDYGESFSAEYKIIDYVCCMMNFKLRKYYSNLVFLFLSVVRTFSPSVGILSLIMFRQVTCRVSPQKNVPLQLTAIAGYKSIFSIGTLCTNMQ